MTADRVEVVRRSWGYIVAWCEAHAPATRSGFHGPSDEVALAAAQAATGLSWPDQLLAWLRLADGAGWSSDAVLIPYGFAPLGVDRIAETWQMLRGVWDTLGPADEIAAAEAQPAGSKTFAFLRSWLPIASDMGGGHLFVDLRPGERSGCVGDFWPDEGTRHHPWDDIAHMLETTANALRVGRCVYRDEHGGDWVRTVEDGRLRWEPGPGMRWNEANPPMLTPDEVRQQARRLFILNCTDDQVAAELGLSVEQTAGLRAAWDRDEERRRAVERHGDLEAWSTEGDVLRAEFSVLPPDEHPATDD